MEIYGQIKIEEILQPFSDILPHFSDGRINYSNSQTALVLTCFVENQRKILLLRRSDKVGTYQKKWNSVAGYIDEFIPLENKILEELREELDLNEENIESISISQPYEFTDKEINKVWIIIPCIAKLKKPPIISLDWEHTDYEWIEPNQITNFDTVPGLDISLKKVL